MRRGLEALKSLRRRALRATDYHVGEQIRRSALLGALGPLLTNGVRQVLDAGSGNGRNSILLARKHPGLRFRGIDIDPAQVAAARDAAGRLALRNVEFAVADVTEPVGESEFDLVYNIDVLEHIEDDRRVLSNFARALRTGGWLVLHTPLSPQRHFLKRCDLSACVNPLHVREGYRPGELEEKIGGVGLEVKKRIFTHGRCGTLAWDLWKANRSRLLRKVLLRPVIQSLVWVEGSGRASPGNCILVAAQKMGA
jgi:SAM-dependent methyltransferase